MHFKTYAKVDPMYAHHLRADHGQTGNYPPADRRWTRSWRRILDILSDENHKFGWLQGLRKWLTEKKLWWQRR